MQTLAIPSGLFPIEPYEGESISHFLGRFRSENDLTASGLGKLTGLGGAIARWEKFRFNPPPSTKDLEALALVVGVTADRLKQMLPPEGIAIKLEPIRICCACYAEQPWHRMEWQYKTTDRCTRHGVTLLSECPECHARFQIPSLWLEGRCHRCFISFAAMCHNQKLL